MAQLKYILPEGIAIKKVNLHDEMTSCMKPELHVTLQVDAFEDALEGKGETGYSILRRVFRERLADFVKRHPEVRPHFHPCFTLFFSSINKIEVLPCFKCYNVTLFHLCF